MSDPSLGMMAYRIGGNVYPRKFRSGCRVCSSPYRAEVEVAISAGQHYSTIAANLPEDAELRPDNLSAHFRGNHMPLRQAAIRRIVEDRQHELGQAIEDGVDQIADHVALARVVVQRSFELIAKGDLEPTVADGIAAAKILQQTGINDEDTDKAAYVEAFIVYMETAQQLMSPEQFAAFGQSLSTNSVLQGLTRRYQKRQTDALE